MRITKIEQSEFKLPTKLTLLNIGTVDVPAELLNQRFSNKRIQCVITETNCAEVNALRRLAIQEMPTRAMILDTMTSSDASLSREEIAIRMRCISIAQNIEVGSKVTLTAKNTNLEKSIFIFTRDLHGVSCNDMVLLSLAPSTDITITAHIEEHANHAAHSAAHTSAFMPLKPDPRDDKGIRTTPISDGNKQSEFAFWIETNGHIDPLALLKNALSELSRRFTAIISMLGDNSYATDAGDVVLQLPGESATTGELIFRHVFANYRKEVHLVTYNVAFVSQMTIIVKPAPGITRDRILAILDTSCKALSTYFAAVKV